MGVVWLLIGGFYFFLLSFSLVWILYYLLSELSVSLITSNDGKILTELTGLSVLQVLMLFYIKRVCFLLIKKFRINLILHMYV